MTFWSTTFLPTRPLIFGKVKQKSLNHLLEAERGPNVENGGGRNLMGVPG
jgi:hypothetical protein